MVQSLTASSWRWMKLRELAKSSAIDALLVITTAGAFVVCAHLCTDVEVALPLWIGWTMAGTPIACVAIWKISVGD